MSLMRIVSSGDDHTIRLPKEFVDRLGIHAGQELTIQLVEEAGLILVFPPRPAPYPRRQPRYDELYDSARELKSTTIPLTSARIQPEAVKALQRMPTDE
jgi:antitoxin component of MazEF toxin-antitoxin module